MAGEVVVRLAACEPCRRSKLACGHEQPVCARCLSRGHRELCIYRNLPFKRRKLGHKSRLSSRSTLPGGSPTGPFRTRPQQNSYPNPGFLGSSSHSTIFHHVSSSTNVVTSDSVADKETGDRVQIPSMEFDQALVEKGSDVLTRLMKLDIASLRGLIVFWQATGASLPLAEHFVSSCTEAVANLVPSALGDTSTWTFRNAGMLFRNTHKPIVVQRNSTISSYLAQMHGDNLRWESIGIFLTAASRATLDVSFFPKLYTSEEERRELTKDLAHLGDDCLEVCLGLDCINDLQLVLQYESFIVFSQVYGDQSYHSWRRMGDLASSLFALGYHEKLDERRPTIPPYIAQLRKASLSRIYTGDKSLAIFLGRPPRIVKPYCVLQLPENDPCIWDDNADTTDETEDLGLPAEVQPGLASHVFSDMDPINCTADTCCAAVFALLKEEILELFRHQDLCRRTEITSEIRTKIESQWLALPEHFKLSTSLKDCRLSPFERDFLVGTRLDYLHTKFLLDLASLRDIAEPNASLLDTARKMLAHVVEAVILRDRLVNSGTCLIWKVALYGLPAAGIVSLALLKPSVANSCNQLQRSEMLQNLTVLVNEINLGAVVATGDPNHELCMRATQTIQSLLDTAMAAQPLGGYSEPGPPLTDQSLNTGLMGDWTPWINAEPWDFELDFWTNLAEHPLLLGNELEA